MPGRVAKRAIRHRGACDESVGRNRARSANKARETHVECESLLLLGWQNRTVPSIRDSQALGRRGLPDRLRSYARRDPVRRGCNYRYGRRGDRTGLVLGPIALTEGGWSPPSRSSFSRPFDGARLRLGDAATQDLQHSTAR